MNTKKTKTSYLFEMIRYYLDPEFRSVFTIFYLIVFGFFALYYLDNVILAIRFIVYVMSATTALYGISYLFTSVVFVVALIIPFSMSLYSIFVLFEVWHRPTWSDYLKWVVTFILIASTLLSVIIADKAARLVAGTDNMRNFIEDTNLTNRIHR